MRLRIILLTLSLLALVSTAAGAMYYYYSLRESAVAQAHRQAASRAQMLTNQISGFLSQNQKPAAALASLHEMQQALLNPRDDEALDQANAVLDKFQRTLGVDVCYLMDATGLTIASSNRKSADTFVGHNFSFRPYYQNAIAGKVAKYLALGTTSKKRGAYYSHPVRGPGGGPPIGVAVIKAPIRLLEKTVIQPGEGVTLLVGPHGVIFSTSRPQWLSHTLWDAPLEEWEAIARTRQFGEGPWPWTGLTRRGEHLVVDQKGREYLFYAAPLAIFPRWRVVYLRDMAEVVRGAWQPFVRTTGVAVLGLCLFAGLSVYFLYRKASQEILRRRVAEQDLRRSEERYRGLYHNTPALLHSIDTSGRLVDVSDYWMEALGYSSQEVIGRRLTDFLTPESRRRAEQEVLPGFFRQGFCKDVSYQFIKKDGSVVEVLLSAIAERDEAGRIVKSLAVLSDVTTLKRTEEELRRAQEKLSQHSRDLERQVRQRTREITSFLRYTPAVVYMKDAQGHYVMVNSRFEEMCGLDTEQLWGKTVQEVFPPAVAAQFQANDQRVLESKRPYQVEERVPHGGEEYTYLSVRFPIIDEGGQVSRLCGIMVNITDLQRAQEKLRRLSGSIMASQEKERNAIARELHDELGQVLTALRMDAVWLRRHLEGADAKAQARAENMCAVIDQTISEVRGIATRLRPPALDDLGLVDALEWHTAEFERRTGIACVFTHAQVPPVGDTIAIAAYRVAQEALTNVARHSGASNVDVALRSDDGRLELSVVDNGAGFAAERLSEREGLGIAGMRERASLAGGELSLRSRPGQGTEVILRLPLDQPRGGVH
ncbi:MAG: PAS domain S-box protein [Desulfarculus sp.]|nr:MAG: PAS domain S-box protein [Desulfarculus sp.]